MILHFVFLIFQFIPQLTVCMTMMIRSLVFPILLFKTLETEI
jgi:hypothetical protein